MPHIQAAAHTLASTISNSVQTVSSTVNTKFDVLASDISVLKHELIQLISLAYSDLLEHTLQGNDANKLFYLKSKILELESSSNPMNSSQDEYLQMLKSQLSKLPKNS